MQKMKRIWLVLAACTSALFACANESPADTAIILTIQSNLGQELTGAWVRVYAADAELPRDADHPVDERKALTAADAARPFLIAKRKDDELLVVIRGFGPGGPTDVIVEHAVHARFVPGKKMAMPVYLAKVCERSACNVSPGQTCYGEAHGLVCEGACGAIYEHDTMFEVEREGDERPVAWMARSCVHGADDGLLDGGTGDRGPDARTPDAGRDAAPAPACLPTIASASCNLFPQCGCTGGKNCTYLKFDITANKPVLSCEQHKQPGGTTLSPCTSVTDCADNYTCLGSTKAYACYALCGSDSDCKSNESCVPGRTPSSVAIEGYNYCRQRCTQNSDCVTACCSGTSEKFCAPHPFCEADTGVQDAGVPGASTCKMAESSKGCTADSDCCGNPSNLPGSCDELQDGTTKCFTKCSSPSQCGSGRCCVDDECFARSLVEAYNADSDAGLNVSSLCAP
jgi:hypothetical protein